MDLYLTLGGNGWILLGNVTSVIRREHDRFHDVTVLPHRLNIPSLPVPAGWALRSQVQIRLCLWSLTLFYIESKISDVRLQGQVTHAESSQRDQERHYPSSMAGMASLRIVLYKPTHEMLLYAPIWPKSCKVKKKKKKKLNGKFRVHHDHDDGVASLTAANFPCL